MPVPFNFDILRQPRLDLVLVTYAYTEYMVVIVYVTALLVFLYYRTVVNKSLNLTFSVNSLLETLWTLFPGILLLYLGVYALALIYSLGVSVPRGGGGVQTLKISGHQWYWTYEEEITSSSAQNCSLEIDSYIKRESLRLLDVWVAPFIQANLPSRILVTSEDVLHSFALPAIGFKLDACPGRLNSAIFMSPGPGLLYGQCSEICGVNHTFIPICLQVV